MPWVTTMNIRFHIAMHPEVVARLRPTADLDSTDGFMTDFDGVGGQLPAGLDSPADLPKITAALIARGYSAEDCRKILGGNLLRVFREVESVSKELQAEDRPRITSKQPFDKPQK